jgi:small subunit ribosomal protein S20
LANHKSSEKRARQSLKKAARNKSVKNQVKTQEKSLLAALEKKAKSAPELLSAYTSKIMKAARKGVISAKTASRKVSRLSKRTSATAK